MTNAREKELWTWIAELEAENASLRARIAELGPITGSIHAPADSMMESPQTVRNAYAGIIAEQKAIIQRYKEAIGQLIALVKQKEGTAQNLTNDVARLEQLKVEALAKQKRLAAELQGQGHSQEEIEGHPEYMKCVAAYNDFSAALEEKNARIKKLEADIEHTQMDIDNHKIQITALMRDLDKTKGEQAEAVENLIDARQQKQIAEMLAEISERKQKLQQRLQQSHSTIS